MPVSCYSINPGSDPTYSHLCAGSWTINTEQTRDLKDCVSREHTNPAGDEGHNKVQAWTCPHEFPSPLPGNLHLSPPQVPLGITRPLSLSLTLFCRSQPS